MKKSYKIAIIIIAIVIIIIVVISLNQSLKRKLGQKIQAITGGNPIIAIPTYFGMEPTGIKNNNPLNIRHSASFNWVGEDTSVKPGNFAKFDTLEHGISAAIRNLHTYITNDGVTNIQGIIDRWAPPSENDDNSYISTVMSQLNEGPYPVLLQTDDVDGTYRQLALIAWAMSGVEVGFTYQPSQDTFIQVQQKLYPDANS